VSAQTRCTRKTNRSIEDRQCHRKVGRRCRRNWSGKRGDMVEIGTTAIHASSSLHQGGQKKPSPKTLAGGGEAQVAKNSRRGGAHLRSARGQPKVECSKKRVWGGQVWCRNGPGGGGDKIRWCHRTVQFRGPCPAITLGGSKKKKCKSKHGGG